MNTNTGSLQNTYNYLVPAAGTTRGYRVTKEFVPGQIEVCDFRNMALDGVSFVPSGVLIDNTRGVGDCVVTILEYSWRIVIPAGQFAHMPYPAPYNQTATIEGNAPELTVVFVDYPVIPFFQNNSGGGSVGGITDIIAGSNISIDKTNPSVPVISATGGGGGGGAKIFYGSGIRDVIGETITLMDYPQGSEAIGITNTDSDFYIPSDTKIIRFNVEISTPYGDDPEPPVLAIFADDTQFIQYPQYVIGTTPQNISGVFIGALTNFFLEKNLSFRLQGKAATQSSVHYATTLELF